MKHLESDLNAIRHNNFILIGNDLREFQEKRYVENAIYYPEFTRIVVITYATLYNENSQMKRFFKKIVNENEFTVIATFIDVLHQLSGEAIKSNPQYFPILCGHNIINYDIPLLIKRFLLYKDKFENNKQLPLILKKSLASKPWESTIIDTINVWKFNGYNNEYLSTLMLITDYLKLKKTTDLDTMIDVSKQYWKHINDNKSKDALDYISLQSATQTNLVIQLINELRQL